MSPGHVRGFIFWSKYVYRCIFRGRTGRALANATAAPQPDRHAARACRVLRPGGALLMMEMDPRLPCWQAKLNNPFAYAAFKATEPWLEEYIKLDVEGSMREIGFEKVAARQNTPTHSTFVGLKPTAA